MDDDTVVQRGMTTYVLNPMNKISHRYLLE